MCQGSIIKIDYTKIKVKAQQTPLLILKNIAPTGATKLLSSTGKVGIGSGWPLHSFNSILDNHQTLKCCFLSFNNLTLINIFQIQVNGRSSSFYLYNT